MNRLIFLTLFIVFSLNGMSQTVIQLPAEYLRNNVTGRNNVPEDVQGTPYWDTEFASGTVSIYGKESYTARLRYNAFSDEIEMETNGALSALLKRDYIRARIGSENYQIEKYKEKNQSRSGYLIPLNEGANRLLLRRTIRFREGKSAESSYDDPLPPRFERSESYYLSKDSDPASPIRLRKKDVLEAFDNDRELQEFVKKNKLKLKSVTEVIQAVDFMNKGN